MSDRHPPSRQRQRPSFDAVPSQGDEPLLWDPQARRFVPAAPPPRRAAPPSNGATEGARRYYVGPEAVGKPPPPRLGSPSRATPTAKAIPAPASKAAPVPAREPAPAPAGRPPRRRLRRRVVALALAVPLVLVIAGLVWANWRFSQIERVEVGQVLDAASGSGTNYLIVGSDSRAGVGADDPNAGAFLDGDDTPQGNRSDTIMVLRVDGDQSRMMSIPRDLFVTIAGTGQEGRINGAFNQGPAALVQTVQDNLDIPVHRYLEVDFVTFAGLVDAVGGVTIDFPHPAFDTSSGLRVEAAGPVVLDGTQALAFVRSRRYTEVVDGDEVVDPTGDIGRVARQQVFLRAVLSEAGSSRNPITLLRVGASVSEGIRIDDEMTFVDSLRLAWRMGRLDPESVVLPTFPFRTSGGADVLGLSDELAPAALDQFR